MGKQLKIRYKHTFENLLSEGETNNLPSETIEGESYTIRELYQRHARGIDITGHNPEDAVFDEDVSHDSLDRSKFKQLDLVEQSELIQINQQNINTLTENREKTIKKHTEKQNLLKSKETKEETHNEPAKSKVDDNVDTKKEKI